MMIDQLYWLWYVCWHCIPALGLRSQSQNMKMPWLTMFQSQNAMNTWHSNIGKAGHQVVIDLFKADLDTFTSKEDHVAYITDALKGLWYIYGNPDLVVSLTWVIYYRIVVLTGRSYRLTAGHTAPFLYQRCTQYTSRRHQQSTHNMGLRRVPWLWWWWRYVMIALLILIGGPNPHLCR